MNPDQNQPLTSLSAQIEAAKKEAGLELPAVASESSKSDPALAKGLHLGLELAVSTLVCTGVGIVLDKHLQTAPLFILLGLVLGMGAGFWHMYRVAIGIEATQVGVSPPPEKNLGRAPQGGQPVGEKE